MQVPVNLKSSLCNSSEVNFLNFDSISDKGSLLA